MMNNLKIKIAPILIGAIFILQSCTSESLKNFKTLPEEFHTFQTPQSNIDSIAFWKSKDELISHIYVTGKEDGAVHIYNANNGDFVGFLKKNSSGLGEFQRPNGILVLEDILYVVERDAHKISIFSLPELTFESSIGFNELQYPYGIAGFTDSIDKSHKIFVTDNPNAGLPQKDRIKHWKINYNEDIQIEYLGLFGNEMFRKVETIACDKELNRLLVAEEETSKNKIVSLNLTDGNLESTPLDTFKFLYEPEGLALIPELDIWIATDQSDNDNRFYIFDRMNLTLLDTIGLNGVTNTDGIAVGKIGEDWFLYAVDDDRRVGSFNLNVLY